MSDKKKTETELTEFNNKPVFKIHKVDSAGIRLESYSMVIAFGVLKAKAILENIDAIKKFVSDNENAK